MIIASEIKMQREKMFGVKVNEQIQNAVFGFGRKTFDICYANDFFFLYFFYCRCKCNEISQFRFFAEQDNLDERS